MMCELERVDYARLDYVYRRHHERFKRRVRSRVPLLTCQACGGDGGEVNVILEDGSGPWDECGWCEGTGYVDAWRRGDWLRCRREERCNSQKERGNG